MKKSLEYLVGNVQELKDLGVYRKLPVMSSHSDAMITVNGKQVINMSSNNYLGFANHPRIKQAMKNAIDQYGVGAGAVRTIIGNTDLHERLDVLLAEFKREEAAMTFQSGFACNAGTIQAISNKGDLLISDELNHASIIDGVRLSRADKAVYKHCDMEDLERILKEKRAQYKTVIILTDGVFSMDGDIAPLPALQALAEKYDALTYVDDAHGSGVLGENGRGTVDHFHLHGRVDFTIGTLSKAVGVVGGYVATNKVVYDWLSHRGRPLLFSTALPPSVIAATIEAITMLKESDVHTKKLWENTHYFQGKLREAGFDLGKTQTPITPVTFGAEDVTMQASKKLFELGVMASPIIFPTVAKGTGRLRCMVSAMHTKEHLDQAVKAFKSL